MSRAESQRPTQELAPAFSNSSSCQPPSANVPNLITHSANFRSSMNNNVLTQLEPPLAGEPESELSRQHPTTWNPPGQTSFQYLPLPDMYSRTTFFDDSSNLNPHLYSASTSAVDSSPNFSFRSGDSNPLVQSTFLSDYGSSVGQVNWAPPASNNDGLAQFPSFVQPNRDGDDGRGHGHGPMFLGGDDTAESYAGPGTGTSRGNNQSY